MSDEMTAMDLCDFYVGSQGREHPMANETVRVNYKDFLAIRTGLAAANERADGLDAAYEGAKTANDQLRIIAASAETDAENLRYTLAQLRTENAALREIVERLPVTADGVTAYPGMELFSSDESIVNVHACNCVPVGNARSILKDICLRQAKWETCYSTRQAALAAQKENEDEQ